MVGQALVRRFRSDPSYELILRDRRALNLADQAAARDFFAETRPAVAIIAAARVGGIQANRSQPVEFMIDNLRIALNTIQAAYEMGVARVLFLGSTCIYPREAPQPIVESSLLTSPLEPTNEAYALAKIAGLKLCQYYRREYGVLFHSAMPTNLYGPGDNYHPEHSHVLPGMIQRFHDAKERRAPEVTIWGTGTPRREFMHVDDLADALAHLINVGDPPDWVNVGTGVDVSILELAHLVAQTVGYEGKIVTDPSRPDGTPRKLTDVSLLASTGWRAKIGLTAGVASTYKSFVAERAAGSMRAV